MSELQDQIREHVIEGVPVFVDVFPATPGLECRDATDDDNVVVEERAVAHAEAVVLAELSMDSALEEHRLDRPGGVEADVVGVDERFPTRREIDVETGGDELD